MKGRTPYRDLKRNTVFGYLEKYPDTPNKTLARMLKRDYPDLFIDIEDARTIVRRYRGKSGKQAREDITITKYYKL